MEVRESITDSVDAELDRLISRRASTDHREDPDEREERWKASVRAHNAKIRERNRWEWVRFFDRMAESHAAVARDYERRAEELCGEATEGAA